MPKVSIIVPIYGVEAYIERCSRSLFEQTLDDVEFIFVNDCTKDNSIAILYEVLKEYPDRKNNVQIIHHKENMGLPTARKTGISVAKGEYIAHCDSDDWVSKEMYKKMYDTAIETSADIVMCNYIRSDGNKEERLNYLKGRLLSGPVWNKIVKSELYKNEIEFPVANKAEDGALMYQLSYYAKHVVCIDDYLYYYFFNPMSITGQVNEKACLSRFEQERQNTELIIRFFSKLDKKKFYKQEIIRWKCQTKKNLLPLMENKTYYRLWLKTYPELNYQMFITSGIDIRHRISYLFVLLHLFPLFKNKVLAWS